MMDAPVGPESGTARPGAGVAVVVQEVLSAIPAGCSWVLPMRDDAGRVVDFQIAAVSGRARDLYGRGVGRVHGRLSELYPSMVGGPLWLAYLEVIATGVPRELPEFRYEQKRAGIAAQSLFDVSVDRVLGGLLVCWQRLDEDQRRLEKTELLGSLGWAEYDLVTGRSDWSPGMYRIYERDPALGPLPRAEQSAAVIGDDRGLREAAWQTMESGVPSDVTLRFQLGGSVKHLRVLSEVGRDANGAPLKIYAVVQDVTAREDSRTAIERLKDRLQTRELTALAEHRLAAQLQSLIQPVPSDPFPLAGLEAVVSYVPAESALRVGGDWYHAQTLPDGLVALAIGDVAGHGLEAASGMAHLRFALVAWLSIGIRDPGALIGYLNRLCDQLDITGTAIVGFYDPATRVLSWSCAGHPPPLLARAATSDEMARPTGMLLGAAADTAYSVDAPQLRAHDLVLFYTDGLIERRAASIAEQTGQLKQALSAGSAAPTAHTLVQLRGRLSYANPYDDTCILAIRVLA